MVTKVHKKILTQKSTLKSSISLDSWIGIFSWLAFHLSARNLGFPLTVQWLLELSGRWDIKEPTRPPLFGHHFLTIRATIKRQSLGGLSWLRMGILVVICDCTSDIATEPNLVPKNSLITTFVP